MCRMLFGTLAFAPTVAPSEHLRYRMIVITRCKRYLYCRACKSVLTAFFAANFTSVKWSVKWDSCALVDTEYKT